MPKYKIVNNPLVINGGVFKRGETIELDEEKAKAYGEDLALVVKTDEGTEEDEGKSVYSETKFKDLKKIATERGLDIKGLNKRADLVKLLEENDAETDEGTEEDEDEDDDE